MDLEVGVLRLSLALNESISLSAHASIHILLVLIIEESAIDFTSALLLLLLLLLSSVAEHATAAATGASLAHVVFVVVGLADEGRLVRV